jgi:hypothetical protein
MQERKIYAFSFLVLYCCVHRSTTNNRAFAQRDVTVRTDDVAKPINNNLVPMTE